MAKKKTSIGKFFPDRKPARFIVRLFSEGETESVYLQKIASAHNVRVDNVCTVSSPVLLVSRAFKWVVENAKMLRKDSGANRIWVVFDDDAKVLDMEEVVRIWKSCPELCLADCKIRDRKRCEFTDVLSRINIGFMTPCFEIWGLMCLGSANSKAASNVVYPEHRHKIQRALHDVMPSYVHDGHPYFEIDKMTGWEQACDRADQWAKTYGEFPDCTHATRFAGIAPLVREIMSV